MTDAKDKVLDALEQYEEKTKLDLPPAAVIETKDLRREVEDGRVSVLISPEGREYHIRSERLARFKRINGVDSTWIVK